MNQNDDAAPLERRVRRFVRPGGGGIYCIGEEYIWSDGRFNISETKSVAWLFSTKKEATAILKRLIAGDPVTARWVYHWPCGFATCCNEQAA
jgi:hypothetical protein